MPYSIEWEPPGGVWLRLTGRVTGAEFVRAVQEVHTHPNYDSLRYVLDDLSGLEVFDVEPATVVQIFAASVGAGMVNPHRRIYVVTTDATVMGYLARMAKEYDGALPITHFATVEQARAAIADAQAAKAGRYLKR